MIILEMKGGVMSREMSVMMRKGRELRMLELMLGPRARFDC